MTTIHVVFNAHLDPIWLWPWHVGLDSALATCRSACDRLDLHPDVVFTRGEAWVYRMIERTDPALFARIQGHLAAGRWEVVGGWWVQPDCNLPSGFGFERQIGLGLRYCQETLGTSPRIAYNVDSFGHAASLPGLMRAAGQDRYIMTRPQAHEKRLPARLFRWRGHEDGPEVVTFRLSSYGTFGPPSLDQVRHSAAELPEGVEHTMFFAGIGDHGGGPTEELIAWVRANQEAIPGCRLVFSSPARFFDAVAGQVDALPLVVGDLQHHAIGCYTVHRPVKTGVRRAEHRLRQAELVVGADPALDEAWRTVCFHQFHDTLGGTCLPSAYQVVLDQLGGAAAVGDELLHTALRAAVAKLPPAPLQRLVIVNASDSPYRGLVRAEAWMERHTWQPHWRVLDEADQPVPWQLVDSEATIGGSTLTSLVLPLDLAPGARRVLRIDPEAGAPAAVAQPVAVTAESIATGGAALDWSARPALRLGDVTLPLPELALVEDLTDTWSHSIDRYPEGPATAARWERPMVIETGPLRAAAVVTGTIGHSELFAEYRVAADEPWVDVLLRVDWRETRKVLKLVLAPPAPLGDRWDGIPGEALRREPDGVERPLRDFTLLALADGTHLAVVCPDVFALDARPHRVRLTLLRSPLLAHHDFQPQARPRALVADRGSHEFRFRFGVVAAGDWQALEVEAFKLHRPPVIATATEGMPAWPAGPKF